MRSSVFAAGALALAASSAHAFLPAPANAPALIKLRPASCRTSLSMSATRTGSRPDPSILGCETVRKQFPEDFGPPVTTPKQVVIEQSSTLVKKVKGGAQAEARINAEASELSKSSNAYAKKLTDHFPGVLDEASYIEAMSRVVKEKGFNPTTSINLVSTCRDEICRPFTETLDSMWGEHFNIASLGGFVFCGKTGFGAGMAHSPVSDGKERYM